MAATLLAMGKSRQNIIGQVNAGGYPIVLQMAQSRCSRDKRRLGVRFARHLIGNIGLSGAETHPGKTPCDQSYLSAVSYRA